MLNSTAGKDALSPIYVPKRAAGVSKIEAALNSPAELNVKDVPLTDVIDYLKDRYKIEIQLDKKAMDKAGIGTDATVTENLKGISLRSALRLMLRELGLTCVIEDGVLSMTTTEAAEEKLMTVIYPVADLVEMATDMRGDAARF